jgi:hypothetical protein
MSFPVAFHTENCAVHSGNPTVSSVHLPTPRWYHLKAHTFLAIHSADEHRMIRSFSNSTSYSTLYAFFSSFWITIWPMWLARRANDSLVFIHHSHMHKKTHRTDKKPTNLIANLCCAREHPVVYRAVFFTQLNCTV